MSSLFSHLKTRGCVHDVSHAEELEKLLDTKSVTFYCGFDPTADSLHVGSMLPLMIMRRLQQAGHKPIALVGSATGMIGDPSGKSDERNLLAEDQIERNVLGLEKQIGLFLDPDGPNGFQMVRNGEWFSDVRFIDFLREVGKLFSVNAMIAKESVKQRLENREQGISYTEFSYMLLQAFDFLHLYKQKKCELQVGGSDQWGNITAGLELIRKKEGSQAFGMTFPLLTTSTGGKFGKTEAGAVWLDSKRTSAYKFYQFWLNTTDADVIRYLQLFTNCPDDDIEELREVTANAPEKREAQKKIAEILTDIVHGSGERVRVENAAQVLFGGDISKLDSKTLVEIFDDVPSTTLPRGEIESGLPLLDALVTSELVKSKGEGRRLVEGGGIYINNVKEADSKKVLDKDDLIDNEVLLLRSGKKKYSLIRCA